MLDVTDRHCRAFLRLFSGRIRLYSEMLVTGSLIHGDREGFLAFDRSEHPVAAQLGGSDAAQLAQCAGYVEAAGYDEVNLNVGCPSDRVKNAQFGACLMKQPELVADCVAAMRDSVSIPVTVKSRTGVDDLDTYDHLASFVETVSAAGCGRFIVHARKAWLKGLSPKQNRSVPPLHYDRVYRLKQDFPQLHITINGGVDSIEASAQHLRRVDGVMVGRQAYHDPWMLSRIDREIFGMANPDLPRSRADAVRQFLPYVEQQLADGVYLRHMTRHMLGLFHGRPGAKSWRRHLSQYGPLKGAGIEVIEEALRYVESGEETASFVVDHPPLQAVGGA